MNTVRQPVSRRNRLLSRLNLPPKPLHHWLNSVMAATRPKAIRPPSLAGCNSPFYSRLLLMLSQASLTNPICGDVLSGGSCAWESSDSFFIKCSSICRITTGSSTQALILNEPWHRSQFSMSILKARYRRWAQGMVAWRSSSVLSSWSVAACSLLLPLPHPAGVISAQFAVGCEDALEGCRVHPGFGYQGSESGIKIQRLENYKGIAIE